MSLDVALTEFDEWPSRVVIGSINMASRATVAARARFIFEANTGLSNNPPGSTTTAKPSSISHGESRIRREQAMRVRCMGFDTQLFELIVSNLLPVQHRP